MRGGDLLARLGGDEFAVLLADGGRAGADAVSVKLREVLAEPLTIEGIALHSRVSIGIAVYPNDGADLPTLLRKADIAMYQAKASGQGHHAYDSAYDTGGATRLVLTEELRTAMTSNQLVLHYQPKVNLSTGEVRSVEALVRWDHPTRDLLYPDAFLTLVDADLVGQVAAMLTTRGIPAHSLQLEITEDFLMADRERARAILTQLRDSGIQIAVDDFGTGYSSLSYLRDLPIDELKLDRTFVFPMTDDAHAAALVASTISLAHSLGLRLAAEGVETQVALSELTRLGCDQAQGYFISRPVPAAELEHLLSNHSDSDDSTDHRRGRGRASATNGDAAEAAPKRRAGRRRRQSMEPRSDPTVG